MSELEKQGKQLETEIANLDPLDRSRENPQTLWSRFKKTITKHAKKTTREAHHRRNTEINNLNKDRERILQDNTLDNDPKLQWEEALLANRITHLERQNSLNQRERLKAKIAFNGEKLGSTWAKLYKQKKPKTNINKLQSTENNQIHFETNSKKMAELAKQYHDHLQEKDLHTPPSEEERRAIVNEALQHIPPTQRIQDMETSALNAGITQAIIDEAL
jgi:hypothetical protein